MGTFDTRCRRSGSVLPAGLVAACGVLALAAGHAPAAAAGEPAVERAVTGGLDWLVARQSRRGSWSANEGRYPTAMTSLAGTALLMEGSTTTQGRYAESIRRAVDAVVGRARTNGLIGDPRTDDRYTYGHGFAMLFLSQVLGEEEDERRREELVRVLSKAVEFSGRAQTKDGGWGYVSAKDGNDFDEGSTTITQVQGLRGCRNAGIPVPRETIDRAIACLFNAGEYDDTHVPRMLEYADKHLGSIANNSFGHWHYAHFYYAQVVYREGGRRWDDYRDQIEKKLLAEAERDRDGTCWTQGYIGPVYTTATNLVILQLERSALPIYQR